ncbi:MAG: hypothetical protein ACKON9_16395, partial [Planctomycetaceae bacterium]
MISGLLCLCFKNRPEWRSAVSGQRLAVSDQRSAIRSLATAPCVFLRVFASSRETNCLQSPGLTTA